ncbi:MULTISPECIES: indole-3-glycerol phosphate synthase TrpC [Bacillus]|uniref:indole-3-glycerol phosphate synthase TrpC n=1 Tax=Bacillus TaxID=1386 RepID=UPI0002EB4658|nr:MULTISPECIES: indole-3-glycerol phosphate synthase TrpC [Bacillus]
MSSILQQILKEKQNEVRIMKEQARKTCPRKPLSLIKAIREKEPIGIIAEIKRHSPSKGALHENVDPIEQAKQYEQSGAAAISVLTDTPFFKGSFSDLEDIRGQVNLPILCKDFIIDEVQIDKAKCVGADAILLIVAALSEDELKTLFDKAIHEGLDVLVEVHDEKELQIAVNLGAKLIGVNNRNLSTFQVDIETTVELAQSPLITNQLLISESGIAIQDDVRKVKQAGAAGILVGETLMKSKDIAATIHELSLKEI